MKIDQIPRTGLIALGVAGLAATALLGFAAGMVVARNPQALGKAARRVAREAARGLEQASLLAAQAREQMGDMWAEVREEARAEVDHADFERAAAAGTVAAAVEPAPAAGPAPRKRKSRAAKSDTDEHGTKSGDEPVKH